MALITFKSQRMNHEDCNFSWKAGVLSSFFYVIDKRGIKSETDCFFNI